jgi:cholest-4-en-3-one 26-monooxygenase
MPGIRRLGDPVRLRSGWINGIKELPVSYRGKGDTRAPSIW